MRRLTGEILNIPLDQIQLEVFKAFLSEVPDELLPVILLIPVLLLAGNSYGVLAYAESVDVETESVSCPNRSGTDDLSGPCDCPRLCLSRII